MTLLFVLNKKKKKVWPLNEVLQYDGPQDPMLDE